MTVVPVIWLAVGVGLLLLELVIPGAVLGFIGVAAIFTGILLHFDVISGFYAATMTFFVSAIFFVLVLRTLLLKFFPSDSVVQNTDETAAAIGVIVQVTETISPYRRGRIRYLETGWEAQSETEMEAGSQAIITGRDGNCWIVKSIEGN